MGPIEAAASKMSRTATINFVLFRKPMIPALAMVVTRSASDLLCPNCAVRIAKEGRTETPTAE